MKATLLIFVTLALVASGCSKKNEAGTTPAAAKISKAQVIERSDPICASANARIREIAAPGDPTTATPDQMSAWATYLASAEQIFGKMLADLLALPDPNEDEAALGDVIEKRADLLGALGTMKTAATEGDADALKAAAGGVNAADEALRTASGAYGFSDCAE